jgi:DNA-binding LytR/AlgR family response regulator
VQAEGDYVRLHTSERSYLIRSTMRSIESCLDPADFVRIHRSAIVALSFVERVERAEPGRTTVTLRDGTALPVGRHYLPNLRDLTAQPQSHRRRAGVER